MCSSPKRGDSVLSILQIRPFLIRSWPNWRVSLTWTNQCAPGFTGAVPRRGVIQVRSARGTSARRHVSRCSEFHPSEGHTETAVRLVSRHLSGLWRANFELP